jgi:hypothetical protein
MRFALALILASLLPLSAYAGAPKGKKAPAAAGKKGAPNVKLKPVEEAPSETPQASAAPPSRGPTRIDFDDRLIQGQTNKSGSVYLYDRKELKVRSMIKTRDSFREEIVGTVYDG